MKKSIAIIGGGAAAMLCACFLNSEKFDITIFEKNKALGRKFLVAGKGGFNLTHSEKLNKLINRYSPKSFLDESLISFDNQSLRSWLQEIGISTYVGSSKRVYPKEGIKPIEVLDAVLEKLKSNNVKISFKSVWKGFSPKGNLFFDKEIKSDYVIFALGGGSWQVTGSSGDWLSFFESKKIKTIPFSSSNCAYEINWNTEFITKNKGFPLKNIAISCGSELQKGEVVITSFGLEGNAIYGLSPAIRNEILENKKAIIFIDFKPTLTEKEIEVKLKRSTFTKMSDILKKDLRLSKSAIDLVKLVTDKETFLDKEKLSAIIKKTTLEVIGMAKLDEAISSVGGISIDEINSTYELYKLPNHYCIGEMLDWDAPTGGYLLQACFSMGVSLAHHLNEE